MGQLGNGVYTSGNKGSNFNFELKTLKALEQIALLIEAGGATPGSQNLQQVTTLGNTTTNELITDGTTHTSSNGTWYGKLSWQGLQFFQGSTTLALNVTMSNELTENRDLAFPNNNGTLAVSVNGQAADSTGNVSLAGSCYQPTITTSSPNLATSKGIGHYYVYNNMVQVFIRFELRSNLIGVNNFDVKFSLPIPILDGSDDALLGTLTIQTDPVLYPLSTSPVRTDLPLQIAMFNVLTPNGVNTSNVMIAGASFSYAIDPGTLTC